MHRKFSKTSSAFFGLHLSKSSIKTTILFVRYLDIFFISSSIFFMPSYYYTSYMVSLSTLDSRSIFGRRFFSKSSTPSSVIKYFSAKLRRTSLPIIPRPLINTFFTSQTSHCVCKRFHKGYQGELIFSLISPSIKPNRKYHLLTSIHLDNLLPQSLVILPAKE